MSIINNTGTSIPSVQTTAYNSFRNRIKDEISKVTTFEDKVDLYTRIMIESTKRMGVMMVKIENEIDMAQVFLWLQEKSYGASLLFANTWHGECLACCDLIRNLLLSPLLNLPLQTQETFYFNNWLTGLERKFGSRADFNSAMKRFIAARRPLLKVPSSFEEQFTKAFGKVGSGDAFIELAEYSKFVTVLEDMKQKIDIQDKVESAKDIQDKVESAKDSQDKVESAKDSQDKVESVKDKLEECKLFIAEINAFLNSEACDAV